MFHVLCGRCCPMETAVESLWCRKVSAFWSLVESHGPCALLDLCFYSQNKLNSWPFYMNPTNPPAYKNVCLAIWLTIYTMLSSGLLSPSLSLYKYVSVYLGYLYIYLHIYMDCMYCIWIVCIYLLLLNTLACLLLSSVSMAFGLSSTGRLPNVTSRNVLRGCALQP